MSLVVNTPSLQKSRFSNGCCLYHAPDSAEMPKKAFEPPAVRLPSERRVPVVRDSSGMASSGKRRTDFGHWPRAGVVSPEGGMGIAINLPEGPRHVKGSRLIDVIDTEPVSERGLLSPRAARGILGSRMVILKGLPLTKVLSFPKKRTLYVRRRWKGATIYVFLTGKPHGA